MDIIWTSKKRCIDNEDDKIDEKKPKTEIIEQPIKINPQPTLQNELYRDKQHVYFYTGVTTASIADLQKMIFESAKELRTVMRSMEDIGLISESPFITLHINSFDGSLLAAFSFVGFVEQFRKQFPNIKLYSVIDGYAASAATIMSVVCDKRTITQYGYMLIHQLSSQAWGKYNDIKDSVTNFDDFMEKIKDIYVKHSKIKRNSLTDILKRDLWWDSKKCIAYGLVDEII